MNAGVILKSKIKEISITGSKVKVPGERESAVFHNQGVAFLDVCKTAGFV